MTASQIEHQRPDARGLQQSAAAVLTGLLAADLPTLSWNLSQVHSYLHTTEPREFPMLLAQSPSHAAVRAWAAHLDAGIYLAFGTTPTVAVVIEGIGVHVWCAPKFRDDDTAGRTETGGA